MSNYAADDTQAIAQRLKELQAERDQYLTGTSAPVTGQEPKAEETQPYGYGYGGMCGVAGTNTYRVTIDPSQMQIGPYGDYWTADYDPA